MKTRTQCPQVFGDYVTVHVKGPGPAQQLYVARKGAHCLVNSSKSRRKSRFLGITLDAYGNKLSPTRVVIWEPELRLSAAPHIVALADYVTEFESNSWFCTLMVRDTIAIHDHVDNWCCGLSKDCPSSVADVS